MLQWLYMYVASVCSKCFSYFRRVLHVFCLGVAYVLHLCCKCFIWILYMFHTYITSVLFGCCICFTLMLQVFHPNVAYVFNTCFPRVSDVCCKCFNRFKRMLQMLSYRCWKVDLVLHMLQWTPSAVAACCSCWAHLHARV
jgi:hypothetical protein